MILIMLAGYVGIKGYYRGEVNRFWRMILFTFIAGGYMIAGFDQLS